MSIVKVKTAAQLEIIRMLFREYAEWMEYALCFESFEKELAELPGPYSFEKQGGLFLAMIDNQPAGCIAMKKVDNLTCEMKRLWVREEFRGHKLGQKLVDRFFRKARKYGYHTITLETTDRMGTAIELYQSLGFSITHRTDNIINMSLTLSSSR